MLQRITIVAALVVAGTTSVNAQDYSINAKQITPDPVTAVYRLSSPVVNRQGDVMNYIAITADNRRTYWNNVPQGMTLSPGLVDPPRTPLSRSRTIVQNGWKNSIDPNTGIVDGSVPLAQGQTVATANVPPTTAPVPDPVVAVYRLSYPITNREGDVMNYVAITADNRRTYWNNVPQGLTLSPGLVDPPRTTFSRSRTIVQNGWKNSIDPKTGTVDGSVPVGQGLTATTANTPQAPVPVPVVAVYRLSYPITNREGDVMNYVAVTADNKQSYWNNVPQGLTVSPGLVTPPRTTFSRSRVVVSNGWKNSIDANTGKVAASVPISQATSTSKMPLSETAPAPAPIPYDQPSVK